MYIKNRTIYSDTEKPFYIFVSDIHGNMHTLPLIRQALEDFHTAQLVGGGDYIDGRKDSKAVVEYLMDKAKNYGAVVLDGNHEELMLNFANGLDYYDSYVDPLWYVNGGKTTIRSFFGRGYSVPKAEHLLRYSKFYSFFKSRPVMYVTPHYIFVHGGVKPVANFDNVSLYNGNSLDTNLSSYDFYRLWARKEYWYDTFAVSNRDETLKSVTKNKIGPYTLKNSKIKLIRFAHNLTKHTIVTGHTPTAFVEGMFTDGRVLRKSAISNCHIKVIQYSNEPARIFTDGGCHGTLPHNYGNVTVLDNQGNIVAVYDFKHPVGVDWQTYVQEIGTEPIFGA